MPRTPSLRTAVSAGYWWAGRDNAILPELASSHEKRLKTRTLRSSSPTTMAPVYFAGDRVHVADPALRGCVRRHLQMLGLLDCKDALAWELVLLWIGFHPRLPKTRLCNHLCNLTTVIKREHLSGRTPAV